MSSYAPGTGADDHHNSGEGSNNPNTSSLYPPRSFPLPIRRSARMSRALDMTRSLEPKIRFSGHYGTSESRALMATNTQYRFRQLIGQQSIYQELEMHSTKYVQNSDKEYISLLEGPALTAFPPEVSRFFPRHKVSHVPTPLGPFSLKVNRHSSNQRLIEAKNTIYSILCERLLTELPFHATRKRHLIEIDSAATDRATGRGSSRGSRGIKFAKIKELLPNNDNDDDNNNNNDDEFAYDDDDDNDDGDYIANHNDDDDDDEGQGGDDEAVM